jgi:hypothetical protein
MKLRSVHERDVALKRHLAREAAGSLVWDPKLQCYYTRPRPLTELEKIPFAKEEPCER